MAPTASSPAGAYSRVLPFIPSARKNGLLKRPQDLPKTGKPLFIREIHRKWISSKLGGRFGYFLFFPAGGRGRKSPRRREGGRDGFFFN